MASSSGAVQLRRRFVRGLQRGSSRDPLGLSPSELSRVAAEAVGASAADLSLVQPLVHLPIGASGRDARLVEHAQASLGEGPCLEAAALSAPVSADQDELVESWPVFHHVLTGRTGLRAAACFPLRHAEGTVFATLGLYGVDPAWRPDADLETVQNDVADLLAMMLLSTMLGRRQGPSWPDDGSAQRRQQVWVATGMVCEAAHANDVDAVAMLRAYAFFHDLLIDDIAEEVVSGRLSPATVVGSR